MRAGILLAWLAFAAPAFGQAHRKSQPTSVNIWVTRNVAPAPRIRMNLNTRNVPTVAITAFPIDPVAWLRNESDAAESRHRPRAAGRPVRQWTVSVATKENRPVPGQADQYFSRQVNLPSLAPGVYLLTVAGGGAEAWAVVNITNLAVITKESPRHLLVWVTDALGGRVLSGVRVLVFDRKTHAQITAGTTGNDGTLFTALPPGARTVVVNRGRDYAGIAAAASDPDGRLVAHFQTDRPIYRPGQTVRFKSILRRTLGNGYAVVPNSKVQVELRDPKNNPIDRSNLATNAMGSMAGQFEVPQEGATGAYTLVLSAGKDQAYHSFEVAEYRKPEYKVDVTPLQKRFLAGETLRFKVSAQYYFGAPVQQAEVRYLARRSELYYGSEEGADAYFYGGDGNLYPRDNYSRQPFMVEDVVHTDNSGEAIIEIKSDPNAGDSTYSLACTATDSSRRQVQGSSSVAVYAANIRLGISTNVVFVPLGRLVPLTLRAADLDGKPVAAAVTLIVSHQVWNERKSEWEQVELARTKTRVPASGVGHANVPADAEGDIEIKAIAPDGTGRSASAMLAAYVVGPFEKVGKEQPNPTISTRLDKRSYEPGETASAYVSANTKKWPILITVEGEDIWNYRVVPGTATFEFHTGRRMSPNAYVSAAQWVKGQLLSSNSIVPLPDKNQLLKVQLRPDKNEYRPGDNATYRVKTTTQTGRPVSAEVAVSVVDAAIYALSPDNTPDLYGLYWGLRPNLVEMRQAAPEELSGGAFQNVPAAQATAVPIRQRFEDTAYWNAFVNTDANGDGTLSFEMPGNLTAWRGVARAVTRQTAVGSDSASVVATRPVTLRLATPRQMVQGDHLTLIGTVNNRTLSAHVFRVRLQPEGIALDSPAEQTLSVPGNGSGAVEWSLHADRLGASPPTLTADVVATDVGADSAGDFADALRMTVPVNPNGVPTDVVSGGVVANSATVHLRLPQDKIEPATKTEVKIWSGVQPVVDESAESVLNAYRYGTLVAADQLQIAALKGLDNSSKPVREALALLSKNESGGGWGYWQNCEPDPVVTAAVLRALALAKGISIPKNMLDGAVGAARAQYDQTNLWEYRARLAAALALVDPKGARPLLDEVVKRGLNLSPDARLRLAAAYLDLADKTSAAPLVEEAIKDVSLGPASAYLPVGEGIGWSANETETTADLLADLLRAGGHDDLQPKLAEWLVGSQGEVWESLEDTTAKARALAAYLVKHPAAAHVGEAAVQVGGQTFVAKHSRIGDLLTVEIPETALTAGDNVIGIAHQGGGEAFFQVSAAVFRPVQSDLDQGIRVVRRYEVQNAAGVWQELNRPLKAGEPVKATVLVWGDELPDVVRVIAPLPAGFEFVDEEESSGAETEVRDAAVVHYALTAGAPVFFTYYIRAESDGDVAALPASAEVLRRPERRGQTGGARIVVIKP